MVLEPQQRNSSLVTWNVILMEDSIYRWKYRRHLRVQLHPYNYFAIMVLLVRNYVLIVRSFHESVLPQPWVPEKAMRTSLKA